METRARHERRAGHGTSTSASDDTESPEGAASSLSTAPTFSAIVSELHLLLERWWEQQPRASERGAQSRAKRIGGRSHDSRAELIASPVPSAANRAPWWEPSERQRLLQQLSSAVDRGEHEAPGADATAAASLIVHSLLTSTRQGALTQAEALACACALNGLCAWRPVEVVVACGGLLERWAIERLEALHPTSTERAAHLELVLVELLLSVSRTQEGRAHLRERGESRTVIHRLREQDVLAERVQRLLRALEES